MRALGPGLSALGGAVPVVRPLVSSGGVPPTDKAIRALKYTIEKFASTGVPEGSSLAETFGKAVQATLVQATAFRALVDQRRFDLVFQPVVSLQTELLHHHEVLVRFGDGASPFDQIRMAEELDLIEELDLAIAQKALGVIASGRRKPPKLAVNISGRSISDRHFVDRLRAEVGRGAGRAGQLVLEITESACIEDFDLVDRHIQSLRGDGHTVCLDDFGAGAASFAYLQRLQVDVVKIDGQYIRTLTDQRAGAMVRHLVGLCRELGVATVAEMVETEEVADAARRAGVDFAQGYLFGRPTAKPEPPPVRPKAGLRRIGAVERWG